MTKFRRLSSKREDRLWALMTEDTDGQHVDADVKAVIRRVNSVLHDLDSEGKLNDAFEALVHHVGNEGIVKRMNAIYDVCDLLYSAKDRLMRLAWEDLLESKRAELDGKSQDVIARAKAKERMDREAYLRRVRADEFAKEQQWEEIKSRWSLAEIRDNAQRLGFVEELQDIDESRSRAKIFQNDAQIFFNRCLTVSDPSMLRAGQLSTAGKYRKARQEMGIE